LAIISSELLSSKGSFARGIWLIQGQFSFYEYLVVYDNLLNQFQDIYGDIFYYIRTPPSLNVNYVAEMGK
jgi:hypothetical protein